MLDVEVRLELVFILHLTGASMVGVIPLSHVGSDLLPWDGVQ